MDNNLLSTTELVRQMITDLRPFTEMLPPQDRLILGKLTEYALHQPAAIANADSLVPLEAALLLILLEEYKRTQNLYSELCAEIERLKGVALQLQGVPLIDENVP